MQDTTEVLVGLRQLVIQLADSGLNINEIGEKLEANYPELVDEYVETQRRGLMNQAIRMIVGSSRRRRMHWARFAEAEDLIEAGESVLLVSFPTPDGRKNLVSMTKADLVFAASDEEQQGRVRLSNGRLLRAIARKVPQGKVVGDVYTSEQIVELLRRFGVEDAS